MKYYTAFVTMHVAHITAPTVCCCIYSCHFIFLVFQIIEKDNSVVFTNANLQTPLLILW